MTTKQQIFDVVPALKFVKFKRLDFDPVDFDFPMRKVIESWNCVFEATIKVNHKNHKVEEVLANVLARDIGANDIPMLYPYPLKDCFEVQCYLKDWVGDLINKANTQINVALHNRDCRETVRGIVTDLPQETILKLWEICRDGTVMAMPDPNTEKSCLQFHPKPSKLNSKPTPETLVPPSYLVTAGPEGTALVQLVTKILETP